ncbi:acetyl-CoA synthetase-like protein [Colletotrichum somersetense]|nr:acetyl-CoA synthetase-like protein [Colletotrichum somersetense]
MIEELERFMTAQGPPLSSVPFSYQAWAELQKSVFTGRAHQTMVRETAPHMAPEASVPGPDFGFWGLRPGQETNVYANVRQHVFAVDKQTTTSVVRGRCHAALRTEAIDMLLAALILSFKRTFPERCVPTIINEGHGREPLDTDDVDLSRTVGWFITMYPVAPGDVEPEFGVVDIVMRVKDARKNWARNGEVLFNYEGSYQRIESGLSLLRPEARTAGEDLVDCNPALGRFGLFIVAAAVLRGCLKFTFRWNANMSHQDRIRYYTGHGEVVFGNLVSGWDAPLRGIDDGVGAFISMLVCRVDVDAPRTLLETMNKVQEDTANGMNHQACSLAEVQHEIRAGSPAPLFTTGISFQPMLSDSSQRGELVFKELKNHDPNEFDLSLIVETCQESLRVSIYYSTVRLSEDAAASVAGTISYFAAQLLQDPHRSASDLPTLSDRDLSAIWSWNARCIPPAREVVNASFERTMLAYPHRQVLYSREGEMTYGELDDLSRRVAGHLAGAYGVGPEVVVPICHEKSNLAIVAMLGVLRAGGCFVMLDPAHPASRLRCIVDQVKPRVILSSVQQEARLRDMAAVQGTSGHHYQVVPLSTDLMARLTTAAGCGDDDYDDDAGTSRLLCGSLTPDNAMYIIFTSGTTGVPKGIVVPHGAYRTGLAEHTAITHTTAETRLLQFSAYSFDASVAEIFPVLAAGGCICTPSEEDRTGDLASFIRRACVNWAGWTPSYPSLVDPNMVPTLETLLLAGEPLTASVVDTWADRLRLINIYGPSECSVSSVVNTKRDHDRLLPVGAVGKLLIEGPILARGYLGDPERTRDVFISAPAWLCTGPLACPCLWLYKTGDLACYNQDGTINYVGRKDTQVKIHGQRVDLGDMEHNIRECVRPLKPAVAAELLQLKGFKMLAVFLVARPQGGEGLAAAAAATDGA